LKQAFLHLLLIMGFGIIPVSTAYAQGLKPPSQPEGVVPLFEPDLPGLSQYYADSTLLQLQYSKYKRLVTLDSSQTKIQIRELLNDRDYYLPIALDLDLYSQDKIENDNKKNWRNTVLKNLGKEEAGGAGGIELNIPVKIKSKAFKRIFGGDRVGLRVTGNISFELAGRAEKRSGSAVSSYEQRGNFSPRFKQTQQFQVEGKVGDKVSVKVDQNSEATFDFENTLRLTYTGDEDEIIQSIEAGNVSLTLPSTNYVSASSKSQGLFGLKTAMQFGNLSFTGIASLQRGEKQKLTKTGGASENTFRIKDYDYVRNRFFFISDVYANYFTQGFNDRMQWTVPDQDDRITQLDVWVTARPNDPDTREGWAVVDPTSVDPADLNNLQVISGVQETGYFRQLNQSEYNYDEHRGYFWLNQNVDEQDVVAIAYKLKKGFQEGVLFSQLSDTSTTVLLKLIRAQGANPNYPTWDLAMRNVYNLGASSISKDGFDVNIIYTKTGTDVDVQPIPPTQPFIYLMGLDRLDEQGSPVEGGDKKVDVNNTNIFNLADGYLIFPSTTPFYPKDEKFPIDTTNLAVKIYDIKDRSKELDQHKFDIEITTSSTSSTFNLGFNVLEGSEIVKLNGRELEKDKDYTIDYFGGTLQILAPEARRADANVEIEYERGSLFQLDKKTLLGARMEYDFGDRGFIGMTGLYLNRSTLDQRVRLGQEPVKNVIWDINTSLRFRPNYLTKALDLLPIVETSAESRLLLEAEYAQVSPNPNTFDEPDLGENNGVAYIDDFEGSKRTTPLGVMYRGWSRASTPVRFRVMNTGIDYDIDRTDENAMYQMDRNRLRMFWYNPYNQVPIKEIWPKRDVNAQTGTTTNVLVLQWKNNSVPEDSAWGGIMRSTVNFPDQKKTKFIELWVKGKLGQVNIDIGKISEDFYVRENTFTYNNRKSLGNLNDEDANLNGLLDDGEDVGLDGIPKGQPNADPFDIWAPPQDTDPAFLQINGTEGNGEAQGAKYPDTEDLDGNGRLNLNDDYFTYSFEIQDTINPYIQGITKLNENQSALDAWRLYRIPIRSYDPNLVIGSPDTSFQEIYYVRLWVNGLPPDGREHTIQIATFDLVGNEWEEVGVARNTGEPFVLNDSLFGIAVYNTEENADEIPGGPEAYHEPPGVTGVVDRITKAKSKEQSLVLQLRQLDPQAEAEAEKQLYEKMNLINYKKLKLFIHGDRSLPVQNSTLQFYLRFGPTKDIYYEVGGNIYPHWDSRNFLDVVLDKLAKTKADEYFIGDSTQAMYYRLNPDNPEQYFKVVGEPNLRNINYMAVGARNIGKFPLDDVEIWIDELRVTDVERDKGSAMRLMADLTLADVATFRAQWEVVDANFRRIEDQFGSGNTTERQSYRATLKMDKFFPSSWGLQIPISGGYVKSRDIPKYYYNSDQLTGYRPSGFTEKVKQFFGMSSLDPVLEENSRLSETKSLGTTLKRSSSPRTPWFLKYSIDMFTFDVDWSEKKASDERNALNNSTSLSGQMQVSVPFGRDNTFRPFGWLGNGPIVRGLANQRMAYTPSALRFNVGINDDESTRQARLEEKPTTVVRTTSSRNYAVSYGIFPSISLDFRRDYQSDAQQKGYRASDLVQAIVTKFDFGVDKVMNQSFGANYNPKWFNWMNQSFKYNANFNYNFSNFKTNEKSSRSQITKQFNVSLQPSLLANKIYNPKVIKNLGRVRGRTSQPTGGGAPRHDIVPDRGGKPEPGSEENQEQQTREDEKPEGEQQKGTQPEPEKKQGQKKEQGQEQQGPNPLSKVKNINPLLLVWKFFNAWKSVGIDYRIQDDYSLFNVTDMPSLKYQLGFSREPGVGTDTTFGKIPVLPGIKNSRTIAGNLEFYIIQNLTSSFKYNYAKDRTQSNQQTSENVATTYFFLGDDPDNNQKSWYQFVPDWQLRLSGVENWFFFKKYANSIQLEHARSGKSNETVRYDGDERVKTSWGYSNNYSPFLGISVNTKWGITGTIRYSKSTIYSYTATGADNKSLRSGIDVTLSFSKSAGFRLPLPFLKNKTLKNEMQFSLSVGSNNDVSYARRQGFEGNKFIEQEKNSSLKFRPSVTYRFSQKVNGSMFFEYSSNQNKRTGKYSYFEFGVNVNIAIR
jgi:hypothetical protein